METIKRVFVQGMHFPIHKAYVVTNRHDRIVTCSESDVGRLAATVSYRFRTEAKLILLVMSSLIQIIRNGLHTFV